MGSRKIRIIKCTVFARANNCHIIMRLDNTVSNKVKVKSAYGEFMGIHYDYKSKRGERAMLKEAKRKARLIQRKAKRMLSSSPDREEGIKTHDIKKIITLEDLTNPNQK